MPQASSDALLLRCRVSEIGRGCQLPASPQPAAATLDRLPGTCRLPVRHHLTARACPPAPAACLAPVTRRPQPRFVHLRHLSFPDVQESTVLVERGGVEQLLCPGKDSKHALDLSLVAQELVLFHSDPGTVPRHHASKELLHGLARDRNRTELYLEGQVGLRCRMRLSTSRPMPHL